MRENLYKLQGGRAKPPVPAKPAAKAVSVEANDFHDD